MSARTNRAKQPDEVDEIFATEAAKSNIHELGLGATPNTEVDDDITKEQVEKGFFQTGRELNKESLAAMAAAAAEAKEKGEKGWTKRLRGWLSRAKKEGAEFNSELAAVIGGTVGAETGVVISDEELKKASDLLFKEAKNENRMFARPLIGDAEDQMDMLQALAAELSEFHEKNSTSKADLAIYERLTKAGSTQSSATGAYSKATAAEQARLRAIEGPHITKDVLRQMSAGKIPWTSNGVFAALSELHSKRWPATGERIKEGDRSGGKVLKFPTGEALGAAAVATLAGAAAAGALKGVPGKNGERFFTTGENSAAEAKASLEKNHEQKNDIDIMAAKYKDELDEALEEQERLNAEMDEILSDVETLASEIRDGQTPIQRTDAIRRNSALIGEYAKYYVALMAGDETLRAEKEAESVEDFIKKTVGPEPGIGDSLEYITGMGEMLQNAIRGTQAKCDELERRIEEISPEISRLEKKLYFYDPDAFPIDKLRERLTDMNERIARYTVELAKEKDLESVRARQLHLHINLVRGEKMELENNIAMYKKKKGQTEAKNLTPEEILRKEKSDSEAQLAKTAERAAACRRDIDAIRNGTYVKPVAVMAPVAKISHLDTWKDLITDTKAGIEAKKKAVTDAVAAKKAPPKKLEPPVFAAGEEKEVKGKILPPFEIIDTGKKETDPEIEAFYIALQTELIELDEKEQKERNRLQEIIEKLDAAHKQQEEEAAKTTVEIMENAMAKIVIHEAGLEKIPTDKLWAEMTELNGADQTKAAEIMVGNRLLSADEAKRLKEDDIRSLKIELASSYRRTINKKGARPSSAPLPTAPTTQPVPGKTDAWAPVEPVVPTRDSMTADFAEANTMPKSGNEMYRTTKADGKARPPNPEAETLVRETLKHAQEILAARKEAYIEDIDTDGLNADELRSKKERLAALTPEEAVLNVLTASSNKRFVVRERNFKHLLPFIGDLHHQIMADTDELIALAEKIAAANPEAAPSPDAGKVEKETPAQIMKQVREKIKALAAEGGDPEEIEAAKDELADAEPKDIGAVLIKEHYLTSEQAQALNRNEMFTLRFELVTALLKEIDKNKTTAEIAPAPPKPDAAISNEKEKLEATAKIMSEARERIKKFSEEKSADELKAAGKAVDEANPKDITDIALTLGEAGILNAGDAAKLKKDQLFTLRNEVVAVYGKAIDAKLGSAPKPDAEPRVKNEFDLLVEKGVAVFEEYKKADIAEMMAIKNKDELLRWIESSNAEIGNIKKFLKTATRETVIEKLAGLKVLTADELEKLNDKKLRRLIDRYIGVIDEVKEKTKERLTELDDSSTDHESPRGGGNVQLAGAPEAPRPPEKEKGSIQDAMSFLSQRAELLERTVDEPGFDLSSYIRTRDALNQTLPSETIRDYLISAGIDNHGKEIAANLSDGELEALRQAEVTHLENIIDRAKPKKTPPIKSNLGEIVAAKEPRKNGKKKKQ